MASARDRLPGISARNRLVPDRALPDRRRFAVDLLAVTTWVLAVAAALHGVGVPAWLYYALVVAGVLGYVLVTARVEAMAERPRPERHNRR